MVCDALQKRLGYTFKNEGYLSHALTHSSCDKLVDNQPYSNERLEFVGDRVLGLVVADMLHKDYPQDSEGQLSKRHAALVRKETLAHIALELNLGDEIVMSEGEEQAGGRTRKSVLADTMEAIIAAIYYDAGYAEAAAWVAKKWAPYVDTVDLANPKSTLQEWLQARGEKLPRYVEIAREGEGEETVFTIEVRTENYGCEQAQGASKQKAGRAAAQLMLDRILKENQ